MKAGRAFSVSVVEMITPTTLLEMLSSREFVRYLFVLLFAAQVLIILLAKASVIFLRPSPGHFM